MELNEVNKFNELDLKSLVQRLEGAFSITEKLLKYPDGASSIINVKLHELKEMIMALPEEKEFLRNNWLLRYLEMHKKFKDIKIEPKTKSSLIKKETLLAADADYNTLSNVNEMQTLASTLSGLLLDGTKADRKLIESGYADLVTAVKNIPEEHCRDLSEWKETLNHYKEALDKDIKARKTNEKKTRYTSFQDTCCETIDLLRSLSVKRVLPPIDWKQIDEKMNIIVTLKCEMDDHDEVDDDGKSKLDAKVEHSFLLYAQVRKREEDESLLSEKKWSPERATD